MPDESLTAPACLPVDVAYTAPEGSMTSKDEKIVAVS